MLETRETYKAQEAHKTYQAQKVMIHKTTPYSYKKQGGDSCWGRVGEAACGLCMELQECSFLDSDVAGV